MGIHGRMGSSVGYSHGPTKTIIMGYHGMPWKKWKKYKHIYQVYIEDLASLFDLSFQQARSCHVFFSDLVPA